MTVISTHFPGFPNHRCYEYPGDPDKVTVLPGYYATEQPK